MKTYLLALSISLIISWILTPFVKKLAFKIGAVDRPNARKVHHRIMPRMGGLAIYIGFMAAAVTCMELTRDVVGILLGGTVIAIVGILDDMFQLAARVKLVGQIIAALVPVCFGVRIEWLNNPWGGYFYLNYLSIPFYGILDRQLHQRGEPDRRAGRTGCRGIRHRLGDGNHGGPAAGSVSGGGDHRGTGNAASSDSSGTTSIRPPSSWGDTGSLFLGYMLAAISIFGAVKSAATIALLVPAIALGLPIMDTAFAIVRRYKNGYPFSARTRDISIIACWPWASASGRL